MAPTVTPLCCGALSMDKSVLVAGCEGREVEAPSLAFLIEADETVLVDTSFGDVASMRERHPSFAPRRAEGQTLRAALEGAGRAPGDVDRVVLSHLDWDHCYNLGLFPDATVNVARRELEYAVSPYPIHADRYEAPSLGRTQPWLGVDLTPLEGEAELCPGVTTFPTPGHTVGHLSVAVETDDGTTVVAADAVPTFENAAGEDPTPGLSMDDLAWWKSAREVLDRADRLLPGHEWGLVDAGPERTG